VVNALQWGRDQLIAELLCLRLGIRLVDWLQWGRDQLIAELTVPSTGVLCQEIASMGPRSADRGIHITEAMKAKDDLLQWGRDQLIAEFCVVEVKINRHQLASMGPRSADRGIRINGLDVRIGQVGFNGAAIS